MPIYEYTCQKCKAHVEIMQKVSDKPLTRHRQCGGRLEKQWSQTSFQLKGSGWYVTDYAGKKSDAKETAEPSESKEAKKDAKKDGPATDKPAAGAAGEKTKEKTPKASATKTPAGSAASGD
jgi:putative FmdB family regulatory protein